MPPETPGWRNAPAAFPEPRRGSVSTLPGETVPPPGPIRPGAPSIGPAPVRQAVSEKTSIPVPLPEFQPGDSAGSAAPGGQPPAAVKASPYWAALRLDVVEDIIDTLNAEPQLERAIGRFAGSSFVLKPDLGGFSLTTDRGGAPETSRIEPLVREVLTDLVRPARSTTVRGGAGVGQPLLEEPRDAAGGLAPCEPPSPVRPREDAGLLSTSMEEFLAEGQVSAAAPPRPTKRPKDAKTYTARCPNCLQFFDFTSDEVGSFRRCQSCGEEFEVLDLVRARRQLDELLKKADEHTAPILLLPLSCCGLLLIPLVLYFYLGLDWSFLKSFGIAWVIDMPLLVLGVGGGRLAAKAAVDRKHRDPINRLAALANVSGDELAGLIKASCQFLGPIW